VIAARESGRRDRRVSPIDQRGACENGGLSLSLTKVKPPVLAHIPLTDERSPPFLSSAFPRSYHIGSVLIPLSAEPKTAFPCVAFLFIYIYCILTCS
jgi:hypothetical protein